MKFIIPTENRSHHFRSLQSIVVRCVMTGCLTVAGLILAGVSLNAFTYNDVPSISWIKDQFIKSGEAFSRQFLAASDRETQLSGQSISVASTNPDFIDPTGITWGVCSTQDHQNGCPAGGYYVDFPAPGSGGLLGPVSTITLKVTDSGPGTHLSAASSFTLRQNTSSNENFPILGSIPNGQVPVSGLRYGPSWFVVDDADESGHDDVIDNNNQRTLTYTWSSDNTAVVANDRIQIDPVGPRNYTVTVLTAIGQQPGRAGITINFKDKDSNTTSTSFVVDMVGLVNNSTTTPPSFSATDGYLLKQPTDSGSAVYNFTVADNETNGSNLRITATSSNANLVPNDPVNNLVVNLPSGGNGVGTLTITPASPVTLGNPQGSTITLSVSDNAYTTRTQFLYVTQNSTIPSFLRPSGIYNLDPIKTVDLDQHRNHADDPFLRGEMRRLSWKEIEKNGQDMPPVWTMLDDDIIANLPPGETLSLNLTDEPCYIAESGNATYTWCDIMASDEQKSCTMSGCTPPGSGIKRALPWDPYLRDRRKLFLQQLANHVIHYHPAGNTGYDYDGVLWKFPQLEMIKPNLPGGDSGIRELDSLTFNTFSGPQGYTRARLLNAAEDEIETVQNYFPGKLVQFGFFNVSDQASPDLSKWLYLEADGYFDPDTGFELVSLASEFDGIKHPRVSFFQEDLAATRDSAAPDFIPYKNPPMLTAYIFTPDACGLPSFAFYCEDDAGNCASGCIGGTGSFNNGIVFQANTPWTAPADPNSNTAKVMNTLNATPNDAIEAAFNAYDSQYLEVYVADLDHAQLPSGSTTTPPSDQARWRSGFQSWNSYTNFVRNTTALEAPAGLTINRDSGVNTLSWGGVYAPMESGPVSYIVKQIVGASSRTVTCNSATDNICSDSGPSGSAPYFYSVQAHVATGNSDSPVSYVALFLSEANNDGYVRNNSSTGFNHEVEPGIRAGRGATNVELRGILSFITSPLNGVTALDAQLHLNQVSPNPVAALGPCKVDIINGFFGADYHLSGVDDFSGNTDTSKPNVTQIPPLASDALTNWVIAPLNPTGVANINRGSTNTGRTQFRIHFDPTLTINNQQAGWNSGDATNYPPQLGVQYQP